jgi:hypothetical protein
VNKLNFSSLINIDDQTLFVKEDISQTRYMFTVTFNLSAEHLKERKQLWIS